MILLCLVIVLLAAVLIWTAAAEKPGQSLAGDTVSWETYNANVDTLFAELSALSVTESKDILITGIVGIPWAEGANDVMDENSGKPRKRLLQVMLTDAQAEAYVVAYYAPGVTGKGYGGIFRQYPEEGSSRLLTSTTSYVPGMIVTTYVFGKDETNLDEDAVVKRDFELTADVQEILDQIYP